MDIVWDRAKAASNPKKHEGVTFEEAKHVLFDPFALTREDRDAQGEQRFVTLVLEEKAEFWLWSTHTGKKLFGLLLLGRQRSLNGENMKNNSDKIYSKFKDYDFADAKTVAKTPHLAKLQASAGKKARITMRVDSNVLSVFKARAEIAGGSYQTLMNEALKQFAHGLNLSDIVRDAVRETLDKHLTKRSNRRSKKRLAA